MRHHPISTASAGIPRRPGFTLLELLIVIVIIAALAALIMGMSRKMTEKAQRIASISSMRQVAAGTLAYTTENNGELNRLLTGEETILHGGKKPSFGFWGRLTPYLFHGLTYNTEEELAASIKDRLPAYLNAKVLQTMQGTPLFGSKIGEDSSGITLPFAFNNNLFELNKLKRISSFDDPARIVYFSYGFEFFDQSDGEKAVSPPITSPATQSNIYWFHDGTAAFTFLDGHVEVLRPPLSAERFQ